MHGGHYRTIGGVYRPHEGMQPTCEVVELGCSVFGTGEIAHVTAGTEIRSATGQQDGADLGGQILQDRNRSVYSCEVQ